MSVIVTYRMDIIKWSKKYISSLLIKYLKLFLPSFCHQNLYAFDLFLCQMFLGQNSAK